MDDIHLKKLLDACYVAKRVVETLPQLPEDMKSRHIHVLDTVYDLQEREEGCRVSDVSRKFGITKPGVTRLVQELEGLSLLEKYPDSRDGRVTLLRLTEKGRACVERHVIAFHKQWSERMVDISDEQAEEAVRVLMQLRQTMPTAESAGRSSVDQ